MEGWCKHMIFKSIDNLASQAKMYLKYLNMKTKLHKTKTIRWKDGGK